MCDDCLEFAIDMRRNAAIDEVMTRLDHVFSKKDHS